MPKTKHLEKHMFKKGQSGNPEGGRAHNPDLRLIKNLTEAEMVEIGSLVVKGSIEDLKKIKDDPKTTVLKAMMASVAIKTIQTGNPQALDILLNRLVGKAKERVEITSDNRTKVSAEVAIVDVSQVRDILTKIRSDV